MLRGGNQVRIAKPDNCINVLNVAHRLIEVAHDNEFDIRISRGDFVDTDIAINDKAVEVCPVGVILRKRVGFAVPIGKRRYDVEPVSAQAKVDAPRKAGPEGVP